MHIIFFFFLGYKLKNQKTKKKTIKPKKTKNQILILKKSWFFPPLNDMRIGSQISTKKAKKIFRAYARTNLIVWPYLWRGPRYATGNVDIAKYFEHDFEDTS